MATVATEPLVVARGLTKRYGAFQALAPCNLQVTRGEVFGLLGPNGAGKTTLLRTLLGYLQPTAGEAHIAGFHCQHARLDMLRNVAYLPGEVRLYRNFTGQQILQFFAEIRGSRDTTASMQIAARLDVDLKRRVAACSSGMRQKLALSAVFAMPTRLLVLDEPTTHLDPTARQEVLTLVAEAHAAGRTILFSSHIFSEVEDVCSRVVILRRGEFVAEQSLVGWRERHRITAVCHGTLRPLPAGLDATLTQTGEQVTLDAPDDLQPLLAWLAAQPLSQVRIEPVGLKNLYATVHGADVQ